MKTKIACFLAAFALLSISAQAALVNTTCTYWNSSTDVMGERFHFGWSAPTDYLQQDYIRENGQQSLPTFHEVGWSLWYDIVATPWQSNQASYYNCPAIEPPTQFKWRSHIQTQAVPPYANKDEYSSYLTWTAPAGTCTQ